METKNPVYEKTDKAIALLNRKAVKRFERAKKRCNLLDFDELNVISVLKELYSDLDSDNRKAFLSLARMAYTDASPHGKNKPDDLWIEMMMLAYDPVALYVYDHEVERKRDYTIEAVISAPEKVKEFRRGLSYWTRMTAHEADRITDEATIKAYKDAGISRVRWVTERDSRVCSHCEPMDGKVYDIDKVPPKPHWGCRCVLVAVEE